MESERRIKGMVEKLIQSVIMAMQDSLDDEQLRMLENVLALNLHGMEIKEECTQLVTSERHWEKILRMYIASKRLENCAESTLIAYRRCITMLFEGRLRKSIKNSRQIHLNTFKLPGSSKVQLNPIWAPIMKR